jgi:hypothetical protein
VSDKYRELALDLKDPAVEFNTRYTSCDAVLYAHRVNNRGVTEAYTIKLRDLSVSELACIARSASRALREKAAADVQQVEENVAWARKAWDQ